MIRNILELILIIVVTTFFNFSKKVAIVEEKMDLFYKGVEDSSISYRVENEVFLVFDYDYIQAIAESAFSGYQISIEKENDCCFVVKVFVEEVFLNKEIMEKFYLKKGDLYD